MIDFKTLTGRDHTAIIAHRGAGHQGRMPTTGENSPAAFDMAIRCGADAIECDLRRTADGYIVIHHNPTLPWERTRLSAMPLAKVQDKGAAHGITIPTLEETLMICAGKISLDLELKEPGYEPDIVSMVRRYYNLRQIIFTSFYDHAVRQLKDAAPEAMTGILVDTQSGLPRLTTRRAEALIRRTRQSGADLIVAHWRLATPSFCRMMDSAGLPLFVWTVNRVATARRLIQSGVAALITDFPERFIQQD